MLLFSTWETMVGSQHVEWSHSTTWRNLKVCISWWRWSPKDSQWKDFLWVIISISIQSFWRWSCHTSRMENHILRRQDRRNWECSCCTCWTLYWQKCGKTVGCFGWRVMKGFLFVPVYLHVLWTLLVVFFVYVCRSWESSVVFFLSVLSSLHSDSCVFNTWWFILFFFLKIHRQQTILATTSCLIIIIDHTFLLSILFCNSFHSTY